MSNLNCDESGFPLDPAPPKVAVIKGQKHPYNVSSGDKAQITVLACCSAGGYVIPPFIIFDLKTLKPGMTEGEVPCSIYGFLQKDGLMRNCLTFGFNITFYSMPHQYVLFYFLSTDIHLIILRVS